MTRLSLVLFEVIYLLKLNTNLLSSDLELKAYLKKDLSKFLEKLREFARCSFLFDFLSFEW